MRIFGQKPVEAAQAKPGKPTMPGPARLARRGVSVGPDFSRIPLHATAYAKQALMVGAPGDVFEQEADRAANQLMDQPQPVAETGEQNEGRRRAVQRGDDQTLSPQERSFFERGLVMISVRSASMPTQGQPRWRMR